MGLNELLQYLTFFLLFSISEFCIGRRHLGSQAGSRFGLA